MISLLLCLALLFLALQGTGVPFLSGIAERTAPALVEAFLRLAFAAHVTALLLLVQRVVSGHHRDSRYHQIFQMEKNNMIPTCSRRSLTLLLSLLSFVVVAPALPAASEGARVVTYSKEEIIPVRAKVRFSTLIVLPDNEEILDFTTGDKEFWIINGAHNLCYVHPAQAGIRSNLNLITASGNVYSFLLTEISSEPNTHPDLKLFVQAKESSESASLAGYVRADEVEAYKKEIERLRAQSEEQVQGAHTQAADEVNRFRSEYGTKLRFDFVLDKKAALEPFLVSAIYHDDRFTYIRCNAREKPALYEVKDGTPNLINFQLENGVYIVPKLLNSGYLAVGKKKATFTRRAATK